MAKDVYEIGEIPPVGEVPRRMHAQLVRPDRYGEPEDAIRDEVIDVPEIGPDDALVLVMAAGVNFNNVWAARGVPVDVTKTQARWGEPTDFHIVGSDAAGVVFAVGDRVTDVRVGDRVVVHAGQWDLDDPWVTGGNDPGLAPTFRVWGYDTCWGSFAQFTKVQAQQCLPKAERLPGQQQHEHGIHDEQVPPQHAHALVDLGDRPAHEHGVRSDGPGHHPDRPLDGGPGPVDVHPLAVARRRQVGRPLVVDRRQGGETLD